MEILEVVKLHFFDSVNQRWLSGCEKAILSEPLKNQTVDFLAPGELLKQANNDVFCTLQPLALLVNGIDGLGERKLAIINWFIKTKKWTYSTQSVPGSLSEQTSFFADS